MLCVKYIVIKECITIILTRFKKDGRIIIFIKYKRCMPQNALMNVQLSLAIIFLSIIKFEIGPKSKYNSIITVLRH